MQKYPELSPSRLDAFCKVMASGSVTKAAGGDPNKQSQYSRQVKELEDALGVTLFHRSGRSMKPTFVAGELSGIISSFTKSLDELVQQHKTANRKVTVGAGNAVYEWMLLPLAHELQNRLPHITLEFRNLRSAEIFEQLRTGQLDLGIATLPKKQKSKTIELHSIRSLKFSVFYPKKQFNHPTLKQLLNSGRLIGLTGEGSYWDQSKELIEACGLEPHLWMQFDSMPMVANALKKTEAVAILPTEAGLDLEDFGYASKSTGELAGFERKYCIANRSQLGPQHKSLSKVLRVLSDLLQ